MTSEALDPRAVRTAGACGTAVALAWLWLASGVVDGVAFIPATVADALVRATPGGVSTFFIDALQHWALRLLAAGVLVVTIVVGAELLWRMRGDDSVRPLPTAGILGLGSAVMLFAPGSGGVNVWTSLFALLVAALFYAGFAGSVYETLTAPADEPRRRSLRFGVTSAVAIALGGGALGWLARSFSGPNRDVELVAPAMPASVPERDPWPDIPGLTPEVTSPEDHYVVDIDLITPSVEAEGWTLRVHGEVERELKLDFASLQGRYEVVEEHSTMCCISNEVGGNLIGTSAWGGVRLADVLEDAGVRAGVVDVVMRATDGYSDSIPIDAALDENTLLAVSQNGAPLLQDHGFPCRVRVPSIYGMKNVKWIVEIELVRSDYLGYWMQRGWSDEAIVKTECRIDVAGTSEVRAGEPTWVAGVAWAGERGITAVEVSVDGGPWQQAMVRDPINDRCWAQWAYRWTPERSGDVTVEARATDGTGAVQTMRETDPHPSGASGYPLARVSVA